MVMEMKLMVDGDGVDDDGGEDGEEIPLPGVESRTNLTPKTKIVVAAELRIANEPLLLGLRVSHIYQASRERRGRDDARWPGGTRWRAQGGGRATQGLLAFRGPFASSKSPDCFSR